MIVSVRVIPQPSLERRHHQLKGDQLVAPMFLHDPARIEGLMTCHFIALFDDNTSHKD
jgi:hypothetical protein